MLNDLEDPRLNRLFQLVNLERGILLGVVRY